MSRSSDFSPGVLVFVKHVIAASLRNSSTTALQVRCVFTYLLLSNGQRVTASNCQHQRQHPHPRVQPTRSPIHRSVARSRMIGDGCGLTLVFPLLRDCPVVITEGQEEGTVKRKERTTTPIPSSS